MHGVRWFLPPVTRRLRDTHHPERTREGSGLEAGARFLTSTVAVTALGLKWLPPRAGHLRGGRRCYNTGASEDGLQQVAEDLAGVKVIFGEPAGGGGVTGVVGGDRA